MKLKLILIVIGVVISAIGVIFNPFVIVKKEDVRTWKTNAYNDSVSVAKLSREVIFKDSLLYSCQQTVDINDKLTTERQIVLADLQKQLKQAKNDARQANEAIEHYESNGLIRYFEKPLLSRCYVEVFEKPDCIKTKK